MLSSRVLFVFSLVFLHRLFSLVVPPTWSYMDSSLTLAFSELIDFQSDEELDAEVSENLIKMDHSSQALATSKDLE